MSGNRSEELIAEGHFIENWSVDECADFIEDAGYPQYKRTFLFNKVVGAYLYTLEQKHLSSLGIRSFAEQKKIMAFLKQLREQEINAKKEELRKQQAEEEAEAAAEEARRLEEEVRMQFRCDILHLPLRSGFGLFIPPYRFGCLLNLLQPMFCQFD